MRFHPACNRYYNQPEAERTGHITERSNRKTGRHGSRHLPGSMTAAWQYVEIPPIL
jgi:hypothetical protein